MDFPDVSLVVQVGLTDATQYEHRVGRTGRVGKIGEGLLLICNDEVRDNPKIFGLPCINVRYICFLRIMFFFLETGLFNFISIPSSRDQV